jgi:hypothetical protein
MSMVNSVTVNLWSLNNRRPLGKGKEGSPKVYSDQFKIGAHNPKVPSSSLGPATMKPLDYSQRVVQRFFYCGLYGIAYAKGEGDLTLTEVKRFLRGDGCPACHFGTICTRCDGAGIENNGCPTCFGKGYVFAQRAQQARDPRFRTWFIG